MTIQLLVVGLGNLPAPLTRHSAGHLIVDLLACRFGTTLSFHRNIGGYIGHCNITLGGADVSLTLFKPKALMNVSGRGVLNALRTSVRAPQSLVVVHDSLEHRPCTLSYKFGGSAQGHNGVRDVVAALSTPDFHRLRIGIGRDPAVDPAAFVLQSFPPQERAFWQRGEGVALVLRHLENIIRMLPRS